jgi:hypothetical protein
MIGKSKKGILSICSNNRENLIMSGEGSLFPMPSQYEVVTWRI